MTDTTGGIETVLARHDLFTPRGYAWLCCSCGDEFVDGQDAALAHVAAAVRAHLLSDAVVERAAEAHWEAWSFNHASRLGINDAAEHGRAMVRAALAAAVGGDTE